MPLRILSDFIVDLGGNAVPDATVAVVNATTGLAAALFADRDGTAPLGTNILTTDAGGSYAAYLADGIYGLTVTKGAVTLALPDRFIGRGSLSPSVNNLLDAADPPAMRIVLQLGSAATAAAGDFAPVSVVSTAQNAATAAAAAQTTANTANTAAATAQAAATAANTAAGAASTAAGAALTAANDAAASAATASGAASAAQSTATAAGTAAAAASTAAGNAQTTATNAGTAAAAAQTTANTATTAAAAAQSTANSANTAAAAAQTTANTAIAALPDKLNRVNPGAQGRYTSPGGNVLTPTPTVGNVIDTTLIRNTTTLSSNASMTFSAAPVDGCEFGWEVTADSTARTVGIPASFSLAKGAVISTFVIPPNTQRFLQWFRKGNGVLELIGEQDPDSIDVSAKLDKDFGALPLIARRLTRDDIIPFMDDIDGNWRLTGDQLDAFVNSLPLGLVGNGTANDTSAYMDLHNLVLEHALELSPSSSGTIWLPPTPLLAGVAGRRVSGYYMLDAYDHHPAISVEAVARGGARIKQRANQSPVRGVRAFIRVLARCKGVTSTDAWDFAFRNVTIDGNKGQQPEEEGWCVYMEPGSDDSEFAYWEAQPGGAGVKGYAGGTWDNCEILGGLGGIFCGGNRQRFHFSSRSINHGIYNAATDTLVVEGGCIRILGNDPELSNFAAGGGTGTSVSCAGNSGNTLVLPNVWNPKQEVVSNSRVAISFTNVNGGSIIGGNLNGQILINGGSGNGPWRGIDIIGVNLRPLDEQFTSNGVTAGTVTDDHHAHVVVKGGHQQVNIKSAFLPSTPAGWSFRHCVSALEGSRVSVDLLDTDNSPGKPYAVAPFYTDSTSRIFHDWSNGSTGRRSVSGYLALPDGSEAYSSPITGVRTIIVGASREMRQNDVRSAGASAVTADGTTVSVTVSGTGHLAATGDQVLVVSQADQDATTNDLRMIGFGEITVTGTTTFTVPQFTPAGTSPITGYANTSDFWVVFQRRWTNQSIWTHEQSATNGAKVLVANLAAGSNNSTHFLQGVFPLLQSMRDQFDHVQGTFAIGNDILGAINDSLAISAMVATTIGNLRTVFDWLAAHGKTWSMEGIPTPNENVALATAYGVVIEDEIEKLMRDYRGKGEYQRYAQDTVTPGAGTGDGGTINAGENVHQNSAAAQMIGLKRGEQWASNRAIPNQPPLIHNIWDRRSAASNSNQIMDAGWSATGQAASALVATKFSGTIWNEITVANLTGASVTCAFGIAQRPDLLGYEQQGLITSAGAAAHILTLALTGASGALLKDRVTAGQYWGGWFEFRVAPSTTTLLKDYAITAHAVVGGVETMLAMARGNGQVFPEDAVRYPFDDQLEMPRHKIPPGFTDYYWKISFQLVNGQTGTVAFAFSRFSCRLMT